MRLVNLNKSNSDFCKNSNKKIFFYSLMLSKSRVKISIKKDLILLKVNNNIAIKFKKAKTVGVKLKERKIFLFGTNPLDLNRLIKRLKFAANPSYFI